MTFVMDDSSIKFLRIHIQSSRPRQRRIRVGKKFPTQHDHGANKTMINMGKRQQTKWKKMANKKEMKGKS